MRSAYAAFRGEHERTEPEQGFQLHSLIEKGVVYFKILFHDSRQCKNRELRYSLFAEYKLGIKEGRIGPDSTFAFQLDDNMQGLSQQCMTGKDKPFQLVF